MCVCMCVCVFMHVCVLVCMTDSIISSCCVARQMITIEITGMY